MAPSPKVQAAFRAMKELGIPEKRTKPVLKKLLALYEKNWKLIEEENYRVLADSIFEDDTEETTQDKSVPEEPVACPVGNVLEQEPQAQDEPERPLKRLRRGGATPNAGPSTPADVGSALKQPKPEPTDDPRACSTPEGSQILPRKNKGKEPLSALPSQSEPRKSPGRASNGLHLKEPTKEPGPVPTLKGKEPATNGLIVPKDEPSTDSMPIDEVPLDVIRPESLLEAEVAPSTANGSSHGQDHLQLGSTDGINEHTGLPSSAAEEQNNLALTVVPDKSLVNGEITTSSLGEKEPNGVSDTNLQSLVVVEQQQLNSDIRDSTDITRGEERVKISLVNQSQRELIPSFHYIPQSVVYLNANVKFSFSQIGDEDYCQTCYGNCLSSSSEIACLCAKGGGFAYTSEGLLKEEFLDECMSMVRNPQKHDIALCSTCPLEKCKNEGMLEPCKGHIKRKFIKECWIKCGCSKICANRVVQRGITRKMQIFWTPEGKGWGLRTLEELPKGAFVCEFVGEVLTISELQQRSVKRKGNEKHSYAVVLDSGWGYGDLQDNQSLCLDGTFYGNVARFINHRCLDANLIEVPVQVETSDRHYYRIALFTTRKIEAMEELTWDYGIDFEGEDHHLKSFPCSCGSNFCRNMKRTSRSRSLSNAR